LNCSYQMNGARSYSREEPIAQGTKQEPPRLRLCQWMKWLTVFFRHREKQRALVDGHNWKETEMRSEEVAVSYMEKEGNLW